MHIKKFIRLIVISFLFFSIKADIFGVSFTLINNTDMELVCSYGDSQNPASRNILPGESCPIIGYRANHLLIWDLKGSKCQGDNNNLQFRSNLTFKDLTVYSLEQLDNPATVFTITKKADRYYFDIDCNQVPYIKARQNQSHSSSSKSTFRKTLVICGIVLATAAFVWRMANRKR